MSIKNFKGFTLVEIMVSVGLLGLLSAVALQMFKTHSSSTTIISAKMDEIEIKRNIMLTLQDSIACKNTFSGISIGQNLTSIQNSNSIPTFIVNSNYGNNKVKIISLKTEDLNLSVGTLRDIDLLVGLTKTVMGKDTSADFKIRLKVAAVGAGAPITDCYSDTNNIIIGADIKICSSLGGNWDAINLKCDLVNYIKKSGDTMNGSLAISAGDLTVATGGVNVNGNIQVTSSGKICINSICRDFSAVNCPTNQMMTGINVNGSLNCAPISTISPNNCIGSWGPCSTTCGGGTQAYTITSSSMNGGTACPFSNGATTSCNTQACALAVNCVGAWGTCSKSCGSGNQTFSVSIPAANGGSQCTVSNGSTQVCNTQACVCQASSFVASNGESCQLPSTYAGNSASCTAKGRPLKCTYQPIMGGKGWSCPSSRWGNTTGYFYSKIGCERSCFALSASVTKTCSLNGNWN